MLNTLCLYLLFFILIVTVYQIIVLKDIPYEIAKKRNHPHQDAIYVGGWVSLLFLNATWPFLWIWASLYSEDSGWGMRQSKEAESQTTQSLEIQLSHLQSRFDKVEQTLGEIIADKNSAKVIAGDS